MIEATNETFADIGRFEAPTADRWYVALPDEPNPFFHPIGDVSGRPVQLFMPEGDEVPRWARLSNELEVWLYNHPVNAAREAAGQRTINGVWLWGAGPQDMPLKPPARRVQAHAPFTRGLARAAGADLAAADRFLHHPEGGFAHVDSLQLRALRQDRSAWLAGLEALERDWFVPLLGALKARQIRQLVVSAPGDKHSLEFTMSTAAPDCSGLQSCRKRPIRMLEDAQARVTQCYMRGTNPTTNQPVREQHATLHPWHTPC